MLNEVLLNPDHQIDKRLLKIMHIIQTTASLSYWKTMAICATVSFRMFLTWLIWKHNTVRLLYRRYQRNLEYLGIILIENNFNLENTFNLWEYLCSEIKIMLGD
jgi:hypothetical protein